MHDDASSATPRDRSSMEDEPTIDLPSSGAPPATGHEPASNLVGTKIGKIRLVQALGEGGMGEVFLGHDETLRRDVAVKTIRGVARADREARVRFRREAEILSKFEHPHVCRLYDLIEDEDCDYLILERVRGRDLRSALKSTTDFTTRLGWALQIADALIAAHDQNVVHRDLKPGNVMVTDQGEIKVLDFGLARIHELDETVPFRSYDASTGPAERGGAPPPFRLDQQVPHSEARFHSGTTFVLGTPGYMSPEQARALPAGPPSDIYSLGLLFQWLFTGKSPFPHQSRSIEDLIEMSALARSLPADDVSDPALRRLIERCKAYRPDMRPTALEVRDRLVSIRDEPRRRRRRRLVATFIVLLSLSTLVSVYGFFRAREAEKAAVRDATRARHVSEFLADLFASIDPLEAGSDLSARDLLDHGMARLETELRENPATRSRVLSAMAASYGAFDEVARAREVQGQAVELGEEAHGPESARVAILRANLGHYFALEGDYEQGLDAARTAQALIQRVDSSPSERIEVQGILAATLVGAGHLDEGEALYREILDLPGSTTNARQRVLVLAALGDLASMKGRWDEAERLQRQAIASAKAQGVTADSIRLRCLGGLGIALYFLEKFPEAEAVNREVLSEYRRILGDRHRRVVYALDNLGEVVYEQSRFEEAEALHREALEIGEDVLGRDHPSVSLTLFSLARTLRARARYDEAEPLYRESLEIRRATFGASHPTVASTLRDLGLLRLDQGRADEARPLLQEALQIYEATLGPEHPESVATRTELGELVGFLLETPGPEAATAAESESAVDMP